MKKKNLYNILTDEELQKISATITDVEKLTLGEIRVAIRKRRHWGEKKLTLHNLAVKEFHHLGMQKTKHRIGVMIFLLLSERKFQIIGDKGIHEKLDDGTWDRVAELMSSHFREQRFCDGIIAAVREVGELLIRHFPENGAKKNELSSDVVVE